METGMENRTVQFEVRCCLAGVKRPLLRVPLAGQPHARGPQPQGNFVQDACFSHFSEAMVTWDQPGDTKGGER